MQICNPKARSASEAVEQFNTLMDDDFNTAGGLAVLFELAKDLRREGNLLVHGQKIETDPDILKRQWHTLVSLARVLGLEAALEDDRPSQGELGLSEAQIEEKIQQRRALKTAKNFVEADRIREELQTQGITLIDKVGGETLWHRS